MYLAVLVVLIRISIFSGISSKNYKKLVLKHQKYVTFDDRSKKRKLNRNLCIKKIDANVDNSCLITTSSLFSIFGHRLVTVLDSNGRKLLALLFVTQTRK